MSKRIFIIESDTAFSRTLEVALSGRGLKVRTADNSEQGVLLARGEPPDLFVVCVEAQPTNGYMICTRLKKEEALRNIPVILISANATPESFEKHKKLKTRAEEYLIKPFPPEVILGKIGQLLGVDLDAPLAEGGAAGLADEPLGLGALVSDDEPVHLSRSEAAEARAAPAFGAVIEEEELVEAEEDPVVPPGKAGPPDDDLKNFEAAFDAISPSAARPDQPDAAGAPAGAAPEPLPLGDAAMLAESDATVLDSAHTEELIALEARVHQLETDLISKSAELEVAKRTSSPGSSGDLLKLKEARAKADKEILRLKQELNEKQKELNEKESELIELRDQQMTFESQAQQLQDDGLKRDAAAKTFERELLQAREELKQVATLKARLAELEAAEKASLERQQKQSEKLAEQTGELEKQKARADESTAELERQRAKAAELESSATALRSQLDTQSAQLNLDLGRAKEEANKLRAELAQTAAEHEQAAADLEQASSETGRLKAEGEQLRQETADLKADLAKAKGEAEKAQAEVQKTQTELTQARVEVQEAIGEKALVAEERDDLARQLEESQAAASRNEERAVKAYQRIKGDEKLREKTRKALQIALQLLDETGPAPEELAPAPDAGQPREQPA